ncbi:MAG: alpha/beta fold hydrolase [Paraglaciecola sp.]|nr:alpha/beta fold hydrolase [Paraglaciecola sp.]
MTDSFLLSSDERLAKTYIDLIQPFWQQHVQQGQVITHDKLSLAYAWVKHPNAIGSIVISSGRIEAYVKYKEVMYDLYQNGYSVFIHDHRGQGLSDRMTGNPHMGYVDDFGDYVADLDLFIQQIVLPNSQEKPHLLCHSMGSAIGALYCMHHPGQIKSAVFMAPMFGIRPALPSWLASLLVTIHVGFNRLLGRPHGYFIGQKNYVSHGFKNNRLTSSEVRYAIFRQEYADLPEVQLGGVTGHWLHAAGKAMDTIEHKAEKFCIPSLAIQAGDDQVVDNARQRRVVAKLRTCKLHTIVNAQHEILMERDVYRRPALRAALTFFAEHH